MSSASDQSPPQPTKKSTTDADRPEEKPHDEPNNDIDNTTSLDSRGKENPDVKKKESKNRSEEKNKKIWEIEEKGLNAFFATPKIDAIKELKGIGGKEAKKAITKIGNSSRRRLVKETALDALDEMNNEDSDENDEAEDTKE